MKGISLKTQQKSSAVNDPYLIYPENLNKSAEIFMLKKSRSNFTQGFIGPLLQSLLFS